MNTQSRAGLARRVGLVCLAYLTTLLAAAESLEAARLSTAGTAGPDSILLLTVPGESPPWRVMRLAAHQTGSLNSYMSSSLRSKAWRFVARGQITKLSDFERAGDPQGRGGKLVAVKLPKREHDGWLSFSLRGLNRGRLLAFVDGRIQPLKRESKRGIFHLSSRAELVLFTADPTLFVEPWELSDIRWTQHVPVPSPWSLRLDEFVTGHEEPRIEWQFGPKRREPLPAAPARVPRAVLRRQRYPTPEGGPPWPESERNRRRWSLWSSSSPWAPPLGRRVASRARAGELHFGNGQAAHDPRIDGLSRGLR